MEEERRYSYSDTNSNTHDSISSSSAAAIDSSNIGFQLLKKHGWKEGSGLGASEQGRLEPVEAYFKKNKRGLGADKVIKKSKNNSIQLSDKGTSSGGNKKGCRALTKKEKTHSKRMRKMKEVEQRLQEKEFERAFFREFWPDNV
ncbi:hypothetical protein Ancab_029193 [Ancistrocladus abbreviatus]